MDVDVVAKEAAMPVYREVIRKGRLDALSITVLFMAMTLGGCTPAAVPETPTNFYFDVDAGTGFYANFTRASNGPAPTMSVFVTPTDTLRSSIMLARDSSLVWKRADEFYLAPADVERLIPREGVDVGSYPIGREMVLLGRFEKGFGRPLSVQERETVDEHPSGVRIYQAESGFDEDALGDLLSKIIEFGREYGGDAIVNLRVLNSHVTLGRRATNVAPSSLGGRPWILRADLIAFTAER
jgi:hypothetical protein